MTKESLEQQETTLKKALGMNLLLEDWVSNLGGVGEGGKGCALIMSLEGCRDACDANIVGCR